MRIAVGAVYQTLTSSFAELHARCDRLGTERGEQRTDNAAVLERTEHRDIQLGNAGREHEQSVAFLYTLFFSAAAKRLVSRDSSP